MAGLSAEKVKIDVSDPGMKKQPTEEFEEVYLLPMRKIFEDKVKHIRQFEVEGCDTEKDIMHKEKVIMMVGSTGSGKMTLINGLINYLYGVEWKDPYRLKLIDESEEANQGDQAKSPTSWITSYKLNHQKGFTEDYSLTVVDTPEFGDTRRIKWDEEITKQIKEFFSTKGHGGLDHFDAIGFVVESSLARLTPTQQYVFDQVLSIFGKDMSKNIFMLLTIADGKIPQATDLSALKAANIEFQVECRFNNSVIYSHPDGNSGEGSDDESFDEMFWKMTKKSFEKFFRELSEVEPRSLVLTQEVLHERETLNIKIDGLNKVVHLGLSKLEELKQTMEQVKTHEAEIQRNKDFKIVVKAEQTVREELPRGTYTTICTKCNRTCHYPCQIPEDSEKMNCWAMDKSGNCHICEDKCNWNLHASFGYRWKFVTVEEVKTSEELYKKYKEAGEKKITAKGIVRKKLEEFEDVQANVFECTSEISRSLNRLQGIALKPNTLNTIDYIDILIRNERSIKMPGLKERLEYLEEIKWKVDTVHQALDENPFLKYSDVLKQGKGIMESKVGRGLRGISKWLSTGIYPE